MNHLSPGPWEHSPTSLDNMKNLKFKSLFTEKYSKLKKETETLVDLNPPEELMSQISEAARESKTVSGLGYLPWIGKDYSLSGMKNKVFFVAESHYKGNSNWNYYDYACVRMAEFALNKDLKRDQSEDDNLAYANLLKTINPFSSLANNKPPFEWEKTLREKKQILSNTVFMNVCQRCLPAGEKPDPEDFINGWHAWFKVARLLKPTLCICDGVASAKTRSRHCFNEAMAQIQAIPEAATLNFSYKRSREGELIGEKGKRVRAHTAQVYIDGNPIEIVWIMHTSLNGRFGYYFEPEEWHKYLEKQPLFKAWKHEMKSKFSSRS